MDAEIRAQCLASTFTRDGVARLNARLLATLGTLEADVGVVDGFGLTDGRCDETKDGRHYPARELAEIAALVALLAPDAAKRRGEGEAAAMCVCVLDTAARSAGKPIFPLVAVL